MKREHLYVHAYKQNKTVTTTRDSKELMIRHLVTFHHPFVTDDSTFLIIIRFCKKPLEENCSGCATSLDEGNQFFHSPSRKKLLPRYLFTFLCRPRNTTANAPCPISSFGLYSKSPTISMIG